VVEELPPELKEKIWEDVIKCKTEDLMDTVRNIDGEIKKSYYILAFDVAFLGYIYRAGDFDGFKNAFHIFTLISIIISIAAAVMNFDPQPVYYHTNFDPLIQCPEKHVKTWFDYLNLRYQRITDAYKEAHKLLEKKSFYY